LLRRSCCRALGKLRRVARTWIKPGALAGRRCDPEDPNAAAIQAWIDQGEEGVARSEPEKIEIPPDEADVVTLFLSLDTQWRWIGQPVTGALIRLGLDYSAVKSVAQAIQVKLTPALFADLRVMENAALQASAEAQR
jgi:Phage related hypothetical protein (DUF1799)